MMPTPLKGLGLIADVVLKPIVICFALPHAKLNYIDSPGRAMPE
jgi:hypothetical protein